MKKQETKSKGSGVGAAVAVGATIAATAAAAYMLFGPEGKKNRKIVKGWSVKMKGEIIEKLEEAKELTEPVYNKVVDQIATKYSKAKGVDAEQLKSVVDDIKKHWKAMVKDKAPKAKPKKK